MNLTKDDLIDLEKTAVNAAYEAGELITKYSGKHISANKKDTGSKLSHKIVTEVDLLSQETILRHLSPTREKYDLGLLAEESSDDGSRFKKDFFWCVDPLDGTLQFTESRPGYSVSIALLSRKGTPYIGVVYDPVTKTMYHAIKNLGAFRNKEKMTFTPDPRISTLTKTTGGAVINACQILENRSAYFLKTPKPQEGGGCIWDYAAISCIFQELGMHVSDAYGKPLELNGSYVYMNRKGVLLAVSFEIAERVIVREAS